MAELLGNLNDRQVEAVQCTEGPVLILAGAGSGKTKTLTNRIAYLIGEKHVEPYHIMAITFTNKAAKEMRERVDALIGEGAEQVWVSTFHSTCVRILRRFIDRLGYGSNFTIYDTDDQKSVVKDVIKRMGLDPKMFKERSAMSFISTCKDELVGPEECRIQCSNGNYNEKMLAKIYMEYQEALMRNNAVDFDDLICLTVKLFKEHGDVLEYYHQKFIYLMVDEYQDTNTAQFELVRLLASKHENLCVVGDDDQSIYRFRGANIRNILDFEDTYPNAKVVKLEQNYRSYQNILNVSNSVIRNNPGRKDKALWSDRGEGDLVCYDVYSNGLEEASGVVRDIMKKARGGYSYKDCAVLYRTNAQSRALEERFISENVPYRVYGGVNFYQRKEIKDILAYLKTVDNGRDDVAVRRIINVPKRGIGATSLAKVDEYAILHGMNFYDALECVDDISGLSRAAGKIADFVTFIEALRAAEHTMGVCDFLKHVIEVTEYEKLIDSEAENDDEVVDRMGNIQEFISKAATFEAMNPSGNLSQFLEEVALIADIDNLDQSANRVSLMTIHSAKGLEFPVVYLTGMEDGLFPGFMSIASGSPEDIEEERRLAYVGITRAMNELHLSSAKGRMIRGEVQYNPVSRFIKEIPKKFLEEHDYTGYGGGSQNPRGSSLSSTGYYGSSSRSNGGIGGRESLAYGSRSVGNGSSYASMSDGAKKKADLWLSREVSKGPTKADHLDYGEGDVVKHVKFGTGKVLGIKDGGRDFEVTVDFENYGVKKMYAAFAKLVKC
ncbi:MAG: UvrD-helicase domain-containing protein [Lachnospiraceae bacterium]|nr:UvrD-helicase domain-containing protein [Lachnospiraceae bacterium]